MRWAVFLAVGLVLSTTVSAQDKNDAAIICMHTTAKQMKIEVKNLNEPIILQEIVDVIIENCASEMGGNIDIYKEDALNFSYISIAPAKCNNLEARAYACVLRSIGWARSYYPGVKKEAAKKYSTKECESYIEDIYNNCEHSKFTQSIEAIDKGVEREFSEPVAINLNNAVHGAERNNITDGRIPKNPFLEKYMKDVNAKLGFRDGRSNAPSIDENPFSKMAAEMARDQGISRPTAKPSDTTIENPE